MFFCNNESLSVRKGFPKKSSFFFGFCPNEGGEGSAQIFCPPGGRGNLDKIQKNTHFYSGNLTYLCVAFPLYLCTLSTQTAIDNNCVSPDDIYGII